MAFDNLIRLGPRLLGEKSIDLQSAHESVQQMMSMYNSYRELLWAFGGAVVFENGARFTCDERCPLNDRDGYQSLEVLLGLGNGKNSIDQKVAQYSGELPANFIPIGESSGGDLICIDDRGAINLWDHESRMNERAWRIAPSIDEFLRRLEPIESIIGNTEGIIESESFLDF